MGYSEQNMGKNEKLTVKAETSMLALVPTIIWAVIIAVIAFMVFIPLAVVSLIMVGVKFLQLKKVELALTNKKLLGKVGVINTKVMDAPLNKINTISVEQKLIGKIFGYGEVVVSTSSGAYTFPFIKNADSFRSAVLNQIDEFDEERIRKQAEQLAGAIKQ